MTDRAELRARLTEALLPCPFCGGEAEMIHGAPGSHYVKCKQCGAASDDRFEDSAIAAWNRRSAIASRQAVVKPDLATVEAVARKVNPGRSEDHIKSVALDALSIIRALQSGRPGEVR